MTGYKDFKTVLAQKLSDEGTCFAARDIIKLKDYKNGFAFTIKDYEHIVYTIKLEPETDDYFIEKYGEITATVSTNDEDGIMFNWFRTQESALKSLALNIGYRIGNTY